MISASDSHNLGAEIHSQPEMWIDWAPQLAKRATEIRDWIAVSGFTEVVLRGGWNLCLHWRNRILRVRYRLVSARVPQTSRPNS